MLLTCVCEACPEELKVLLIWHNPVFLYCHKWTGSTYMKKNVNSKNSNAGLTPGVSLNPLKFWTARFTGPGGRLAWLLCELRPWNTLMHVNSVIPWKGRLHLLHKQHKYNLNVNLSYKTFIPIFQHKFSKLTEHYGTVVYKTQPSVNLSDMNSPLRSKSMWLSAFSIDAP